MTPANVATLEGGHAHLKFGVIILIGAAGVWLGSLLASSPGPLRSEDRLRRGCVT